MSKSWRGAQDEWTPEGPPRMSQSHTNLVKRMSMLMQDPAGPRRKVASQGNLRQFTAFSVGRPLQIKPRTGDTSDDSDKEEQIVRIDSPSALFNTSRRVP